MLAVVLLTAVATVVRADAVSPPTITGPELARLSSTVTISGHAVAQQNVAIWFHRKGDPPSAYTLRRNLTADAAGSYRDDVRRRHRLPLLRRIRAAQIADGAHPGHIGVPHRPGPRCAGLHRGHPGTALPLGAKVDVYFHRAGEPAGFYSLRRQLRSDRAGAWSTSYRASADQIYYATSNGLTSGAQRTVAGAVYVFPIAPAGVADYADVHHDYPATDVFAPCDSNVVAVTDGVLQEVSVLDRWDPATDDPAVRGGLTISLIGDDGVRYYMAHLHDILPGIAPGVRMRHGQLVAHVGETGNARGLGCHVHFGCRRPAAPVTGASGAGCSTRGRTWIRGARVDRIHPSRR